MLELVKIKEDIAWIIEQIKCLLSRSLAATAWSEDHTVETGGSYTIDTLVWYDKCIYICKRNNNSALPTNTAYWSSMGPGMLLEEKIPDWLAVKGKSTYIKNKPTKTSDFINDGEGNGSNFVTESFVVSVAETSDKHYTHLQIIALSSWIVTHNLNKNPSITVIDSGNNVVIGDYITVSSNEVILNFTAPFSGKAFFN